MLELKDIQNLHKTAEKTIKVKAWNGEVRIRQLTTAERLQVTDITLEGVKLKQNGSDEKSEFSEVNMTNIIKAHILTASLGLVEPKLSIEDIKNMGDGVMSGITEIAEEINKFNQEKKS